MLTVKEAIPRPSGDELTHTNPDSAEQIERSLEEIKPLVEQAFKEAIERANRVDWEQRTGRSHG